MENDHYYKTQAATMAVGWQVDDRRYLQCYGAQLKIIQKALQNWFDFWWIFVIGDELSPIVQLIFYLTNSVITKFAE